MRGRKYELFYDGDRLRLIAWRTPRGAYWVSNTLSPEADQQADARDRPLADAHRQLTCAAAAPRPRTTLTRPS